jgi:gamma-tubulin complex component 5
LIPDHEKAEKRIKRVKMAPSTPVTSTQEQLLQLLLPKSITAGKSRKYREAFNRRVKHQNYARTNQFEVIERLDGLEEKFQILNRDDLSDALRSRRAELRSHESASRLLPDVLDLLLRLSVDPTNIKRSDRLISVKERPSELPPLRWSDIEKHDPINHSDPIWQIQEFSDFSSDEDVVAISSTATSPQSVKRIDGKADDGALEHDDKNFVAPPWPESVDLSIYRNFGANEEATAVLLGELQATRECLFMLQGLPTNLYSGDNTVHAPNTNYSLRNVGNEVFWEVLNSFGQIGKRAGFVKGWLAEVQTTQFTRTLRQSIEDYVSIFDAGIGEIQGRILRPSGKAHFGLLPCLEAVSQLFKDLEVVWEYLRLCEAKKADPIVQLEVLFDLICSKQAAGNPREASKLLEVFIPALQVYLKPMRHWMKYGELHESLEDFFVTSSGQQRDLARLWEGWFVLDESLGKNRAPCFLKQFSQSVFALGKTSLFLHYLDDKHDEVPLEALSLIQQDDLSETLASGYLSFAEKFAGTFSSDITPALGQISSRLYQQLDRQCGLWNVLDVFGYIYFATRGPTTDNIERSIFKRLDRCQTTWSDRFVLLDLFENAFMNTPELETDRLLIHSSHTSSRSIESRRKSVKILGDLSVNYRLPWQIANIIPQSCFASYRRISLLLMQIRRSRYSLERRAHFHVMNAPVDSDIAERNITRELYQKLLLFGNVLYSHLTALVIDSSTLWMKERMRQASNVDEMTQVHTSYIMNLEKACLTSKKLTPIRDGITSVLDLSIRFADIVTTPSGGRSADDDDARSFRSAASRPRVNRKLHAEDSEDEDEDNEANSGDEGYSTFIVLDDSSPAEEFRRMSREFDRCLAFVIAGLKSLGRVDGEESWDVLAGRLDWKTKSEY